ncbi:methionine--tRNA ligase [Candidatus Peregrinibacteria bacterium]|nr:methionine--tRNA ligase [Candidatus Peregrinibacteria bacterium]
MTQEKPFYVTTSIAYVNAAPHLGFAMESIEADVVARWMRFQNRETYFLTGTDEHGVKIANTAKGLGMTEKELCDKNSERYRDLKSALSLSNNDFIRTSDQKKHWPGTHKLWKLMAKNGDIEKRQYSALYCYGCEAFMTEKDLDEKGECPNHKRKPEMISEENYFFTLSKYSQKIADLIESNTLEIIPEFRKTEILNLAKSGLFDVSFSRPTEKLPWGVSVPGDPSQTMYVWCDALTNYISALGYGGDEKLFLKFWNDGEVLHIIGKDILRFHAGIWIGMLLSAGVKIPDKILVHGFLTSEGQKMSKSIGNVVDPFSEVEKYGADALRYFLIREVPLGRDADFSRKRFDEIYQSGLANGLGNLSSRIYTLCSRNRVFTLPDELFEDFAGLLVAAEAGLYNAMSKFSLHEGLGSIFYVVDALDKLMDELKPWLLITENPEHARKVLANFLVTIVWVARNLEPFLPETSEKMKQMFGNGEGIFGEGMMLFPRIEKLEEQTLFSLPKEQSSQKKNRFLDFKFTISRAAEKLGIQAEYIILENIHVKKSSRTLQKAMKQTVEEWRESGGRNNKQWKMIIDEQNAIKEKCGVSPEKFPSGPVFLASLVEKNGKLPSINTIVDIYNIISLKKGLSAGAHDLEFFPKKSAKIDITTGEEEFIPLNTDTAQKIQKGEYAFFCDDKKIACRLDSLQCDSTKTTEKTRDVLVYFQAPKNCSSELLSEAKTEFLEMVEQFVRE